MNRRPGEGKTSEKALEAARKQQLALELRKAGATYSQIKEQLGYASESGAYKAVKLALRKMMLEAGGEEVLRLELARLDRLLMAAWKQATTDPPNLNALEKVLNILDRRLKWQGYEPPKKVELTGADGQPLQVQTEQIDWSKATTEDLRYLKSLRERLAQRATGAAVENN